MKLYIFVALSLAAGACKSTALGNLSDDESQICDSGTYMPFKLTTTEIDPTTIGYEKNPEDPYSVRNPDSDNNLRIDTCYDEINSAVTVRKVVQKRPGTSSPFFLMPIGSQDTVQNSESIVFEDGKGLLIKTEPSFSGSFYEIKAWANPNGPPLITFAYIRNGFPHSGLTGIPAYVLAGKLEQGDPFSDRVCGLETREESTKMNVFGTTIEIRSCSHIADGHTNFYEPYYLAATESDGTLKVFDTKEKVGQVLKFVINHHNSCDPAYLDLDSMKLGFRSPDITGCIEPDLEKVPKRPENEPSDEHNLLRFYKMDENGGVLEEGSVKCRHLFRCTPQ
ncbi:MAG: hypothetical protein AB7T49_14130 [Oligoflexales bacterium]